MRTTRVWIGATVLLSVATLGRGFQGCKAWRPRVRVAGSLARMQVEESAEVDSAEARGAADAKAPLLDVLQAAGPRATRTEINEMVLRLEKLNPTSDPATSSLLNGEWEVLYAGGIAPGPLFAQAIGSLPPALSSAVDLSSVKLAISREQPRVSATAMLQLGRIDARVQVQYRLEAESGFRLLETYETGTVEAAPLNFALPRLMGSSAKLLEKAVSRPIFITYLDDELLISRDAIGGFDLLVRKEKAFMEQTPMSVPSVDDADAAPGAS